MKKSKIPIIYEDDYVFAVNKPPRIMSVPADRDPRSRTQLTKSVLEIIKKQFENKGFTPYLLHRLDMNTSGVMLFGKRERDKGTLEDIFKDERTNKIYVALVKGVPKAGVINHGLKSRYKGEEQEEWKMAAHTEFNVDRIYKVFGSFACALVSVKILTGRKHQIRQHFANIGFPVVMDDQHGDKLFNRKFRLQYWLGRQFLHAEKLEFYHPFLKKIVNIEAAVAPDLKLTLKRITMPRRR